MCEGKVRMKDKIKEAGGILLIVALAAVVFSVGQSKTKENVCYKDLFAMDTYFSMKVYGEQGEEALLLCEEKIQEFEAAWSVTDKDSEVSRLNSLGSTAVSEATFQLVQKALLLCRETEGRWILHFIPCRKHGDSPQVTMQCPGRDRFRCFLIRQITGELSWKNRMQPLLYRKVWKLIWELLQKGIRGIVSLQF